MDKYVSTYIGRPLAVFERDYDTRWPDHDLEPGEGDVWVDVVKEEKGETRGSYEPLPGRVLECFGAASKLCTCARLVSVLVLIFRAAAILSRIVEALYSIRPAPGSRSNERILLEEELEKWMLSLKPYLRYDITRGVIEGSGKVPPPHVLTLHMMYWCSVLLLHRPSYVRFSLVLRRANLDQHPVQQTADAQVCFPRGLHHLGPVDQHPVDPRDRLVQARREPHYQDCLDVRGAL
jgi:hypothetical protein